MSDNERPGGWVPGIGWVALLRDLHDDDTATWGDKAAVAGVSWLRSTLDDNVPLIVTRWGDGSTPEPPSPWEQLCAAVDALSAMPRPLPEPLRASVEGAVVDLAALCESEPPKRLPSDPNAEVRMALVVNATHYAREGKWERAYMDLSTACGMLSDATGQPIKDALDRITEAAPDPWWKRLPDVTELPEWRDVLERHGDLLAERDLARRAGIGVSPMCRDRLAAAAESLIAAVDSRGENW